MTSRLVFHFKDGSLQDETAVFTQRGQFRLISDHLVQKGRAFERPLDMQIDGPSGQVTVRYLDEDGQEKIENERLELPPDLANGLIITLLKNVRRAALPADFFVRRRHTQAATREVEGHRGGRRSVFGRRFRAPRDALRDQGRHRRLAGLIAPFVGKEPPDSHVWILEGEAPAFVRSEATLFMGGPLCGLI